MEVLVTCLIFISPTVAHTLHHNAPGSLEILLHGTGQAGQNGMPVECIICKIYCLQSVASCGLVHVHVHAQPEHALSYLSTILMSSVQKQSDLITSDCHSNDPPTGPGLCNRAGLGDWQICDLCSRGSFCTGSDKMTCGRLPWGFDKRC